MLSFQSQGQETHVKSYHFLFSFDFFFLLCPQKTLFFSKCIWRSRGARTLMWLLFFCYTNLPKIKKKKKTVPRPGWRATHFGRAAAAVLFLAHDGWGGDGGGVGGVGVGGGGAEGQL